MLCFQKLWPVLPMCWNNISMLLFDRFKCILLFSSCLKTYKQTWKAEHQSEKGVPWWLIMTPGCRSVCYQPSVATNKNPRGPQGILWESRCTLRREWNWLQNLAKVHYVINILVKQWQGYGLTRGALNFAGASQQRGSSPFQTSSNLFWEHFLPFCSNSPEWLLALGKI